MILRRSINFVLLLFLLVLLSSSMEVDRAQEAGGLLLRIPVAVDGRSEYFINIREGVPVRETVLEFIKERGVDQSHEGAITEEIRRKLHDAGPEIVAKLDPHDHIEIIQVFVDVSGRQENGTFVLDGREELQVLQFCTSKQQGARCVSSILKSIAHHYEHRRMIKSAFPDGGNGGGKEGQEERREPQLAIRTRVNNESTLLLGYPGEGVTQVVDRFVNEHQIPLALKKTVTNAVVDAVLGLLDYDHPIVLNFDEQGRPIMGQQEEAITEQKLSPALTIASTEEDPEDSSWSSSSSNKATSASSSSLFSASSSIVTSRPPKIYTIDMYVNQEQRPLFLQEGEDFQSKAREWCLQQGTQDPEHFQFVLDAIVQGVKEQNLREELHVYHNQLDRVLAGPSDQELFRFNASGAYPPVIVIGGNSTANQVAEAWCTEHDIRASEVALVALMITREYDAWLQKEEAVLKGKVVNNHNSDRSSTLKMLSITFLIGCISVAIAYTPRGLLKIRSV